MKKSLFIQFVEKYFGPIVRKLTETINGKKEEEQLLHTTMLTEEYSPDLNWGSTELQTSIVAADVVAVNSTIPLKRRDSIRSASGKIPKLGIKFVKNEADINSLNIMAASGTDDATIAAKLLNDVPRAVNGIRHRVEIMFQQALSTGQVLVTGDENTGTGVRATFGYQAENIFHCTAGAWGSGSEEPLEDIEQVFAKASADGNTIALVMLSKDYFNRMRSSAAGRMLVANRNNQIIIDPTTLNKPSRSAFLEALEDEYGATFKVVDSAFKIEGPNGERQTVRPWEQANVVFLTSESVGRLVYGRLAEETNPVADVAYQKSGSYILVSKYSKNEPLREFTSAQAFVIPVIDGGNSIYVLHADASGLAELKPSADTLEFAATAATKTMDVHYDGEKKLTATAEGDWLTVSVSKDKVKVAVKANDTEAERNAEVSVTDGSVTATFTVTQSNE